MSEILLRDLVSVTSGHLQMADLPPLRGDLEVVRHIDFDLHSLTPGGLYWELRSGKQAVLGRAETAFLKGAAGVLVEQRQVEPWAGRYSLRVPNAQLALRHLSYIIRRRRSSKVIGIAHQEISRQIISALRVTIACSPSTIHPMRVTFLPDSTPLSATAPSDILVLNDHCTPHLDASLLLAAPDLMLIDKAHASRFFFSATELLHRTIEALQPDGVLVYSDLPDFSEFRRGVFSNAPSPLEWFRPFREAGIRCFHIGTGCHADLRVLPVGTSGGQYHVQIDGYSLVFTEHTFHQLMARLHVYATAILMGHDVAEAARRLKFPRPQSSPSRRQLFSPTLGRDNMPMASPTATPQEPD